MFAETVVEHMPISAHTILNQLVVTLLIYCPLFVWHMYYTSGQVIHLAPSKILGLFIYHTHINTSQTQLVRLYLISLRCT